MRLRPRQRKTRLAALLNSPPAGIAHSDHEGSDDEVFRRAARQHCLDRPANSSETCVVEQAVQSPVTLHCVGNKRLDLALLPNVGAE